MALTLRHIEVIRAVLRAGTVTRAARQLAVSQPALSRTLKNAESRLGLQLFERSAGRLSPTPEALALHRDIEKAYAQIEAIERASTDLRHVTGGRLAIVCNPSAAATVVAAALGRMTQSAPGLRVSLQTALNYEVIEAVRARSADVGFAWDVPAHPAVVATEIGQARLVCLIPEGHALATAKAVTARQLHEVPLISFSTTLPLGAATESAFAESGVTRRIGIEVGQTFIAASLVRQRAGIAIVDELALGGLHEGLVVRPFLPRRAVRLYAVMRPERPSLVVQAFLDLVTAVAAQAKGHGLRAAPRARRSVTPLLGN
jgi:DNA-binding transcriptional LysR family regulator